MKKIIKPLLLVVLFLVVIFLIAFPQLLKKNPSLLNSNKLTKEDLDVICGVELRYSENESMGIKYQKLWNNRNIETEFDDLTFYLFKNERQARKFFELAKKTTFSEVLDEGDNFVKGWEDGVMDAQVIKYYYLDRNLIVKTDLYVTSDWGMSPDGIIPGNDNDTRTRNVNEEEVIKMIKENF